MLLDLLTSGKIRCCDPECGRTSCYVGTLLHRPLLAAVYLQCFHRLTENQQRVNWHALYYRHCQIYIHDESSLMTTGTVQRAGRVRCHWVVQAG